MPTTKIAITLADKTVARLDRLVKNRAFPGRSRAIPEAVEEKLQRLEHGRPSRDCAKLDPESEKNLAEQGMSGLLEQ